MPTIPQIAHQVDIAAPASGNHITITYTDTKTETVDLNTTYSPFYIQGDGANEDLLDALKDALASATHLTSAVVTLETTQRVRISVKSSIKTISTLTLVQSDFKPYHLGFAVDTTTTVISGFTTVGASEIVDADFRPPSTWCPSTEDFGGLRTRRDVVI